MADNPSVGQLSRALDMLALAYHETPEGEPADDDAEPPHCPISMELVTQRFPSLGYYAVVAPAPDLDVKPLMGDAIDDIADIARELWEVSWRFDNFGREDADWYFRFLFEAHWGRHLRELSLYLHNQQWPMG